MGIFLRITSLHPVLLLLMLEGSLLVGTAAEWILPRNLRQDAGSSADSDSPAIISGVIVTDRTQYPHLARIFMSSTNDGSGAQCSGSLISTSYVLTAGHCIVASPSKFKWLFGGRTLYALFQVTLGDLSKSAIEPNEQVISGEGIPYTKYPSKSGAVDPTDIGLIKLSRPATINAYVRPIALPSSSYVITDGTDAEAAGWGVYIASSSGSKVSSDELRTGQLRAYRGNSQCSSVFKKTHICTEPAASGTPQQICSGDSGGPIMQFVGGTKVVVGVSSYADSNCGVYSGAGAVAVAPYLDWINSYIS